jgi:glycosyltransferase involved in cell wall biosynthesis
MTRPVLHVVLPGPVDTATGGYRYDRHMIAELRLLGWYVEVTSLPAEFPFPTARALGAAAALFASLPDGALVLVDGLAFGTLADEVRPQAGRLRIAALVHHPLHAETGLDTPRQRALFESERAALGLAHRVFVTSAATARMMCDSGLVAAPPLVVVPGTSPAPLRSPSNAAATRLLCVATLTPRKCHALLFEALAALRDLPWTLDCVGSADFDPPTAAGLRARLAASGLEERIRLRGECDALELRQLQLRADLFVLPSAFEGYGMAVAEALAQGLPVVATRTGAAAELVGTDAGLLVEPGDLRGLTAALRTLLQDPSRREACATAARTRAASLPRWADSARLLAAGLDGMRAT